MQLLGLFDVYIEMTMEITVRKYVLHCSICLHADHSNQTILVYRYHIQTESDWLNVTSLKLPWLITWCWKMPLWNDASANHRVRYNFTWLT